MVIVACERRDHVGAQLAQPHRAPFRTRALDMQRGVCAVWRERVVRARQRLERSVRGSDQRAPEQAGSSRSKLTKSANPDNDELATASNADSSPVAAALEHSPARARKTRGPDRTGFGGRRSGYRARDCSPRSAAHDLGRRPAPGQIPETAYIPAFGRADRQAGRDRLHHVSRREGAGWRAGRSRLERDPHATARCDGEVTFILQHTVDVTGLQARARRIPAALARSRC
jgi:hypothetical protein